MSAIATLVLRVSLGALTVGPRADICNVVAGHWRKLMKQVFDAYRPELHYMRGPGPKWHEKHAAAEERGHLAARPPRPSECAHRRRPSGKQLPGPPENVVPDRRRDLRSAMHVEFADFMGRPSCSQSECRKPSCSATRSKGLRKRALLSRPVRAGAPAQGPGREVRHRPVTLCGRQGFLLVRWRAPVTAAAHPRLLMLTPLRPTGSQGRPASAGFGGSERTCCSGTVGTPFAKRGLRCHYKSVTFKGYPGSIGRASLADPTVIPGPPQERLAWHHLAGRSQERCSRGNSDQIVSCWVIRSQPCRGGEQQKECDDETSFCSGVSRCLCRRMYSQLCTRRLCTRCWLCPRIWSWRLCARSYDSSWEPRAADTHL